jgi:phosphopantothenate synthetase
MFSKISGAFVCINIFYQRKNKVFKTQQHLHDAGAATAMYSVELSLLLLTVELLLSHLYKTLSDFTTN